MGLNRAQRIVAVVGLTAGVVFVVLPFSSVSDLVLYDGVVVLAVVVAVVGLRRLPPTHRLPWLLATLAMGLWLGGELIWWGYATAGLDPYPSIGDGLFLIGYLPLGLAVAALASDSEHDRDRASWLDAGVLVAVAMLLLWEPAFETTVTDPTIGLLEKSVTIAYPLADLMVFGLLLRLLLSRRARTRASIFLAAGVAATLAADVAFVVLEASGSYTGGSWLDLVWLVGYLSIALGVLDRSAATPVAVPDSAGLNRGRLVLIMVALIIPQAMLFVALGEAGLTGWSTTGLAAGTSLIVITLIATRLWRLLGRARRLEARRASSRLSTLIHHSSDAVLLVDAEGLISYASPAIEDLWGLDPEACVDQYVFSNADEEERWALKAQLHDLVDSPMGTLKPFEYTGYARSGLQRTVEGTLRNLLEDEDVGAIVATERDISDRRMLEAQLQRQAFSDGLTGLANRALFSDRVRHALTRSTRSSNTTVAVLFIDLDNFKSINDGMGHGAGDVLLNHVGERIQSCVRPADTLARIGGDEFALLLEDLSSVEQATQMAERILEVLQLPISVLDLDILVPASIGIAIGTGASTEESLLRDADIAMYSAKSHGKGRVRVFDDSLRQAAERHLALRIELPQALAAGQFHLVYQPIHERGEGGMVGSEALVRWEHPSRGLVAPLDFIPAAEESGFIVDLGRWILNEACQQAVTFNATSARPQTIAVNVSAVQLSHPDFIADVASALHETGLPAQLLTIELTESVFADPDAFAPILDAVRDTGVGIAIDDFGTGYSSLSYLRAFPVTCVKIDRSFVNELTEHRDDSMVRSIIAMAHALGLTAIAEGVETPEQLRVLEALDCDQLQGYYLGHPKKPAELLGTALPTTDRPVSPTRHATT